MSSIYRARDRKSTLTQRERARAHAFHAVLLHLFALNYTNLMRAGLSEGTLETLPSLENLLSSFQTAHSRVNSARMAEVASDIWTVPNFLEPNECNRLIARAEMAGFEGATIATRAGAARDEAARNNDRAIVDDADLARTLWLRLAGHIPAFVEGRQAIGLNERFRFYRYTPGQQFKGHVDGAFVRPNGEASLLTFMVYPNDGFRGGETAFQAAAIAPVCGLALIFRHNLFHEGRAVVDGRKYVMRSDVMFNPVGRISG